MVAARVSYSLRTPELPVPTSRISAELGANANDAILSTGHRDNTGLCDERDTIW